MLNSLLFKERAGYVEKIAKKVEQVDRIKAALDEKRKKIHDEIKRRKTFNGGIRILSNINQRELRILGIVYKGIVDVEKVLYEVRGELEKEGIFRTLFSSLKQRRYEPLQNSFLLKLYYNSLKSSLKKMDRTIKAIRNRVEEERELLRLILEYIGSGNEREAFDLFERKFIPVYESEINLIRKINNNKTIRYLTRVIERASPKDAAIIAATRVVPVELAVDAGAAVVFGPQYVPIFHLTTVFLRYLATFGYSAYALNKVVKR